MVSYDVKAPFTSTPVDPAINIVQNKLQQDPLLSHKPTFQSPKSSACLSYALKTPTSSSRVSV